MAIFPEQAIYELSKEYFENNPNLDKFELPKAVLGSKVEVGINKQNRVCKYLINELPFIDEKKGFLIVNKTGFLEWAELVKKRYEQRADERTINEKYPKLVELIEKNEDTLNAGKRQNEQKQKEIDAMDIQLKEQEQIKAVKNNEFEELKKKVEELKEEERIKEQEKADFIKGNELILAEYEQKKKSYSSLGLFEDVFSFQKRYRQELDFYMTKARETIAKIKFEKN